MPNNKEKDSDTDYNLAMNHWGWTENLLKAAGVETNKLHSFLYIQAFTHGMKHQREKSKVNNE